MKKILDKYEKYPSIFFAAFCLNYIVVVAFALVLAGCMPPNIVMRYEPTSEAVPLNLETRPKIFLERIEDRTGGASVSYGGVAEWKFNSPIDETLREALHKEMGRLGIDVVGSHSQANAVLSAAWVKGRIGNDRGNQYAEIAVALNLKTPKGEDIWENTILATSRHYTSIRGDVFSHAFTEALTAAMRQIGPLWESKQVFSKLSTGGAETAAVITPLAVRSDVDEFPAIKAKLNKNSYAIVIGIEQYRQKLPKADYAVNDAKTMTEYLTKVMGYPEENVVTLLNEHATNVDFAKYFEKWLPNNAEKDGTVFVYYSGHGAPNPKTGDAYLVPYDGDPSFIDETGYSLKRLYESLGKLQAKEIVVALDSCFSGAGGRSVIAKGARPLVMTMEKTAVPSNIAVLSAASGEQISSTYEEKGHGLFTYFMLKGIKGEGDANGDGKVEIGELFEYIKPQVERIARKVYNNEQSSQLIAPNERQGVFFNK